jgi:hypothetical protein
MKAPATVTGGGIRGCSPEDGSAIGSGEGALCEIIMPDTARTIQVSSLIGVPQSEQLLNGHRDDAETR